MTIRLVLLPEEQLKQESGLSSRDVLHFVETRFIHQLVGVTIKRKLLEARRSGGIDNESLATFAAARYHHTFRIIVLHTVCFRLFSLI